MATFKRDVDAALAEVARDNLVQRIWARDDTVWKHGPGEITDRLGWLTVVADLRERVGELAAFAAEVRDAGYADVVLLGMGGSSLAPEVLRASFGKQRGYPRLHVLDSTVPAWVRRVTRSIDPGRTLFIVSSKTGGTIEVVSFFKYFHGLVASLRGKRAGDSFIAITDPNTGLQKMAETYGFRRVFTNPADIGGRYSALSYFGLVPAALAGIDPLRLLDSGLRMVSACGPGVPAAGNPGAWLGAALGAMERAGRDKVTIVTSPSVVAFGLWAEQLLAESTGKEGKGLVPVAQEPPAAVSAYGKDRIFVYLRLDGDDNAASDTHAANLESAGQPVIPLALRSRFDLGAEFFRWEFATALAGALIGIHPFDQPNVQESKDNTAAVLSQVSAGGQPPALEATGSLPALLAQAKRGDYVAVLAYVDETPLVDAAFRDLRHALLERCHLPSTLGYGPRYLHSTGQLHKGGPDSGLFVQMTADWGTDLPVPGEAYTFAGLAASQAAGDYKSLQTHQRRAIRIHLGQRAAASIRKLAGAM